MEFSGFVKYFGSYTTEQLEKTKQDLKLEMPIELLAPMANHYRTHEKRDPYIDELMLWDALYSSNADSAYSVAATELLTNDTFVAETYADLMAKRKLLRPNAKSVCSLGCIVTFKAQANLHNTKAKQNKADSTNKAEDKFRKIVYYRKDNSYLKLNRNR